MAEPLSFVTVLLKGEKMERKIEVILSDRKTISVEITSDLRVVVRAPKRMKKGDITRFIDGKTPWIESHLALAHERAEKRKMTAEPPFTAEELERLTALAREKLIPRVQQWAERMGVTYGRITVRHQATRWGSCSSKGNLNFNCLIMLCPEQVMEYVIVHELCHRREMNHSKRFWSEVERYCKDCRACREWLKNEGSALIRRLKEK